MRSLICRQPQIRTRKSWCRSPIDSAIIWRWFTTGDFIKEPPKTTDELIELAVENTVDEDGDGRKDRYGLVWNFTEPFFAIPFLTGFGGWVFADRPNIGSDQTP